ncbi:MAG: hypothetical protein J5896_06740 [Alphaproteobacteria bacterium]|nr:hypothetical protein [Alphaproteobacteria bacterium]
MKKCIYDYKNSCTCAEDDKCGCDFDNNMAHDFACTFDEREIIKKSAPQTHPQTSSQILNKKS